MILRTGAKRTEMEAQNWLHLLNTGSIIRCVRASDIRSSIRRVKRSKSDIQSFDIVVIIAIKEWQSKQYIGV